MRCDHRFKLVGYRDRTEPENPDDQWLKTAVLVCLRCGREQLTGVDEIPPATVVERMQGAEAAEEEGP